MFWLHSAPHSVRVFMNPCACIGSLSLHTLFLNISVFLASFFISYFCINRSSSIAIRWPKNAHGKYPKAVNAFRVEAHALAHAHAHLWRGKQAHTLTHTVPYNMYAMLSRMYREGFSFFVTYTQRCRLACKANKANFLFIPRVSVCLCACECISLSIVCVCQAREILPARCWVLDTELFSLWKFFANGSRLFFSHCPPQTRGHRVAQRGDSSIACLSVCTSVCVCVWRLPVLSFLFLGNRRNRKLSKQLEAFAFTHRYGSLSLWLYVWLNIYMYI